MSIAAFVLSTVLLAACADMQLQAGRQVGVEQLKQLTVGQSTAEEVQSKLGAPLGKGRSYMPYQAKHVDIWTYYYELGTLEDTRRTFLFVYIDQGKYDGHMWFSSLPEEDR
jgi:hypothetical protein